jgi:hypothetical protein
VLIVRLQSALKILRTQKGIALLETIPLLVIFVMLMSFALGLFGVVHTAVLHNIAARTYSYETFRQRTNLTYFREDGSGLVVSTVGVYKRKGWRYHAIQHESDPRLTFVATVRPIALGNQVPAGDASATTNNQSVYQIPVRNDRISVNPAWIMVGYGICLNMNCGD